MEKVIQALNDYENKIALPPHIPPGEEDELQGYFILDRRSIETMSSSQAAATAVRLSSYAFYLQREINREEARVTWCDEQLTDAVAQPIKQYDQYTKHEVKISLIAKENTYVANVLKLKRYAGQRVKRLSFLATSTKHLSESFLAVQRANWKPNYERE